MPHAGGSNIEVAHRLSVHNASPDSLAREVLEIAEAILLALVAKLRQLRCLRCRFDCYRVERTSSRAGLAPAEVQRLSRRTVSTAIKKNGKISLTQQRRSQSRFPYVCQLVTCSIFPSVGITPWARLTGVVEEPGKIGPG